MISQDIRMLSHSVSQLPGLFLVKDVNSRIIGISKQFATILGYDKIDHALGQFDIEVPSSSSELHREFIEQDQQIFKTQKKLSTLDFIKYSTGWMMVHNQVIPCLDANSNDMCTFCNTIEIENNSQIYRMFWSLYKIDKSFLDSKTKNISYTLDNHLATSIFTERQLQCVFFLLRGKTAKQIGKILGVSHRTIEEHFDKIKNKLGCKTRSQVVEKAIDMGLLYMLPNVSLDNPLFKNML